MSEKPVIVLAGPTAVGKTELSLELARAVRGEIVSADSMQVYRHMDIGSAKIPPEERQGIPHHLLDCCEPWEEFHVVRFQQEARKALEDIWSRGRLPIVTGGTGFYIQALLRDIDFTETGGNPAYRAALEQEAAERGPEALHRRLAQVDPAAAAEIHPHNAKRIIRALEYFHDTGEPISVHNARERRRPSPYTYAYFVLNRERPELYRRIGLRVDAMMEQGLLDEVRRLRQMGCTRRMVSMQGLGYQELLEYLDGELSLEEAVEKIKRETRHYAKRQITWFKREKDAVWLNWEDFPDTASMRTAVLARCRERGILSPLPGESEDGGEYQEGKEEAFHE